MIRGNVLLTGATGFIGGALQRAFPLFADVRAKLFTMSRRPGCDVLGDPSRHIPEYSWSLVVHAAPCNVGPAIEVAKRRGAKLLYLSSGTVCGKRGQTDEESPILAESIYACRKALDEERVRHSGVSYTIARIYTLYGPGLPSHFAFAEFEESAKNGQPVLVDSPLTVRSYMHVDDCAEWLWRLPEGTFCVGSREAFDMSAVASAIATKYGVRAGPSGRRVEPTSYWPNVDEAELLGLTYRSWQ